MSVLNVSELSVGFASEHGTLEVISDLSLRIAPGETLGLVGESGCGKSLTATAIMGLLPKPHGQILGGDIRCLVNPYWHQLKPSVANIAAKTWRWFFKSP